MQVTIGSKYQIVIPKAVRDKVKGIKPGGKVNVQFSDDSSITIKPTTQNWSDVNYGKYKKYLIGAATEVEKMRNEWEERLKEFESSK